MHLEVLFSLLGKQQLFGNIVAQDRLARLAQKEQLLSQTPNAEQTQPQASLIVDILDSYYSKIVPGTFKTVHLIHVASGDTLYFQLPGDVQTKTFYCPVNIAWL